METSPLRATPGAPSWFCLAAVSLLAVLLASVGAAHAAAAAKPVGGPRSLAVSVPPDPVAIKPGTSAKTLARISNPTDAAVRVTVQSRTLSLGNDGKVTIGAGPDPRWNTLVDFPKSVLAIPAESYVDVLLTIRVPAHLQPNLYFVGFLVTPVVTASGSLEVINQIGSFVTIDVPGARTRKLTAIFDVPSIVLGSRVNGMLRVANVGPAAVRFWGENDTTSQPGGSFVQQRLDPSLLPSRKSRFFSVTAKPAWLVGMVKMQVHVIYPGRTEATTREMTFSKQVLVVSPVVPAALGLLLLAIVGLVWRSRRKRRRRSSLWPMPA